jgi:hypothetical protein
MRHAALFAVMMAFTGLHHGVAHAQQDCPIRTGDPVEAVKQHFRLDAEPFKYPKPTPGGAAYHYQLADRGVWIFFDNALRVTNMRFNAPFAGKVGDVAVGDSKEAVRRVHGEPNSIMSQGMVDTRAFESRQRRKQQLIDGLPDPAPRSEVMRAFEQMKRIDAEPFPYLTAWIYYPRTPDFVRFDFGADDRVQIVFSSHCSSAARRSSGR